MPPLSDIPFGGEEGPGSGLAAPIAVRPEAPGAGVTLISFGTSGGAGTNFVLTSVEQIVVSPPPVGLTAWGFNDGSGGFPAFGAISPGTFNGQSIVRYGTSLTTTVPPPPPDIQAFVIGFTGTLMQDFFVDTTINGFTFLAAAADTLTHFGGNTYWQWTGAFPFNSAGTFPVVFN